MAERVAPGGERCWAFIGVWGDRSCPELVHHAHYHHCPVIGRAANALLATTPRGAVAASPFDNPDESRSGPGVLCFRLGEELMAIEAARVVEVTGLLQPHVVPHRAVPWLLGVVALHGRLELLISLTRLFGEDTDPADLGRIVLFEVGGRRWAFPVSEVHSVERVPPEVVEPAPMRLGSTAVGHLQAILTLRGARYGWLDPRSLDGELARWLS